MWEFYERLVQRAVITSEVAVRYARHVGEVLSEALPVKELNGLREELPPEYWELSERVPKDPHYYGSLERT